MPRWTAEARARQAQIARQRQPWTKSTGPKTAAGKNRSKYNAYKHGLESAAALKLRHAMRCHSLWLRDCLRIHSLTPPRRSLQAKGEAILPDASLEAPASRLAASAPPSRNDDCANNNIRPARFDRGNTENVVKSTSCKLIFNHSAPILSGVSFCGPSSVHTNTSEKEIMSESITTDKTFTLTNDSTGESIKLPVLHGTAGPDVLDVRKLYAQSNHFTFDPSYTSTASCKSRITFIDGDEGILMHRGYNIKELARKSTFMETCYLLLEGDLPNEQQLKEFTHAITMHTMVHDQMNYFFRGFRRDAHPMAVMVGVVGAMAAFYHDSLDIYDPKQREISAHRLIAKLPTIAAMTYKYSIGQPFMYPRNDLNYAENFLYQCFAVPAEPYKVSPILSKAMDRIFILHADHEQNASTSTVRLAGSSQANPFACIAAGIACLWGPAHGGANQEVLEMLAEIGDASRIPEFIAKAKDKDDPFRLMGFGHRVYKNMDPRAEIMRESCYEVLDELGLHDEPMLKLAMELEKAALADPYFAERKLFPNVDFYSGIILKAMGFPTSMFTVLFAVSRTVGWISQWKEMIEEPELRIGRPRQLYTGSAARPYVEIDKR